MLGFGLRGGLAHGPILPRATPSGRAGDLGRETDLAVRARSVRRGLGHGGGLHCLSVARLSESMVTPT
ncbi:hypothetical protein STRAU_6686 [Streptomyces aurantiacus JA 4570]|uniref:Uncharacterized protein n=1 Tax=Streptomyces aurantiacus JA 4570 TaxID=1286094 RepID=S3ZPH1_9ACTN|nr:hypothetical protein STRAU_6686 [Streptomyces aurantiacus JA 4570]